MGGDQKTSHSIGLGLNKVWRNADIESHVQPVRRLERTALTGRSSAALDARQGIFKSSGKENAHRGG